MSTATKYRKRRDVVTASISSLVNNVSGCEKEFDHESSIISARPFMKKLDKLTSEFKIHYYNLLYRMKNLPRNSKPL